MRSRDAEEAIFDLNEFLVTRYPDSVLQFITGMMIGWTHSGKKQPSESEIDLAWKKYFELLRVSIDRTLSYISTYPYTNVRRTILSTPSPTYEKEKLDQVVALLGNMPSDEAIEFVVEVTTNYCFSIPISFLPLLPISPPPNESDEAIANAIYEWLMRYYDLWP